jgi:1-acyl-sn-glycerol-3-phosphate acyltransferase
LKLRWRIAWAAIYPLARFLVNLRVSGREKLSYGPQILASNHVSNADPVIVGLASARELHFLAKEELFRASRLFDWLIRTWNAFPVRRGAIDPGTIKHCSRLLRRKQTLLLFPEGTRSRTGEIARFRPGIGLLAVSSQAPVVPMLIAGLDRSWVSYMADTDFVRRGLRRKSRTPTPVHVVFGEPVSPCGFSRSRQGYEELTSEVEQRVRKLKESVECRVPL